MASERMMQAVGKLERAVTRLELQAGEIVDRDPPGIDVAAARAALHSIDALIADLKARGDG